MSTILDLAAIRDRIGRYERLTDRAAPGDATAVGLAAGGCTADIRPLLAAVDAAYTELATIRAQATDPALLRWCDWPGCWSHFNAVAGPTRQGWIRVARQHLLLCPGHAVAGHIPGFDVDSTLRTVVAHCSCGDADAVAGGNVAAVGGNVAAVGGWWRRHVEQDAAGIAPGV